MYLDRLDGLADHLCSMVFAGWCSSSDTEATMFRAVFEGRRDEGGGATGVSGKNSDVFPVGGKWFDVGTM